MSYSKGLGNALGEGLGLFAQSAIQRQDQLRAQQQQEDAIRRQQEQQALDNQYRQGQAALQTRQLDLTERQINDQRGDTEYNRDRQARLDASKTREDTARNASPSYTAFQQGVDADVQRYAPTLKDGRANPQYDRGMYEAAVGRQKQATKLWAKFTGAVGSGEGFEDARKAFLAFIGEGDDVAVPGEPVIAPGTPTVPAPMDMSFAPAATATPTATPAQATQPTAQPTALPARVQDIPPSQLASFSDADLAAQYGQGGVEYARAARAEYTAQQQAQAATALKVRTDSWKIQLDELAKRTDLTGDQRIALVTITSLMARPNLSEDEATQLTQAFGLLTPKMYDSTSWQKVLDSKDPAVILAQLPVYRQFAPQVVQGFDPTPLQTAMDADLDGKAASAAASRAAALNSEAGANATNQKLPGELAQQGAQLAATQATIAGTLATTAKTRAETGQIGVQVDVAKQKAGLEGIDALASLPADMTYYQMTQGNPALVARIKNQLGLNDQGMANLWRQAQYKYGLGLSGEELKNDLATAQIANTQSDTLSQNAQRGLTIAQTEGERADTARVQALLPGEVAAQPVQRAATAAQARASDAAAASSYANANRITTLTPIEAAQGQADVTNTQARTGLVTAQTANAWANTGKVAADIQNDRQRTAAYVSSVKGQYAVNMATVQSLTAGTALKRAQNPNDPLYNPAVVTSKPGDPIDKLKKQAGVFYTQADQALKQANSLQGQIDSLTKAGTGIGGFDMTKLPKADQDKLTSLITQRDKLMSVAINRRASGDKVLTDGLPGATNAAGGGTTEVPFKNISAQPGVPLTGIKPALVKGIDAMLQNFTAPGGLRPVITEGVRTREQQAALYAKGRTAPGNIVTNAKPGTGLHESGTAIDISWVDPTTGKVLAGTDPRAQAAWKALGAQAPKYGLRWGGTFKTADGKPFVDMYHFEVAGGGTQQAARPPAPTQPAKAAFKTNPGLEKNLASALQSGNRDRFDAVWAQMQQAGYSQDQITAIAKAAQK